jgi:surface protein
MLGIFRQDTVFNQDISSWNTSSAITMYSMFEGAEAFNQDIGNWDLSSVTDINGMFNGALAFNQDISGWDTSKVTDMSYIFYMATGFAQDISTWNISSVTYAEGMFEECNLSYTNYNSLLSGWSNQLVQSNVIFGGGYSVYTIIGKAGRDILTDTYDWIITDGGLYTLPAVPPNITYSYGNSTNLSNVPDLEAVENYTIQTLTANVVFNSPVNFSGVNDVTQQIKVFPGAIIVDIAANPSLNVSATVSLDMASVMTNNVVPCDDFILYYATGSFSTLTEVVTNGQIVATNANIGGDCSDASICQNIQCANGILTFDAQHFDGFGVGQNLPAEAGILNVRTLVFAAFSLMAVILLATAAFAIINIFKDGDISSLMVIVISVIGLAVVLFVGYIIISLVASLLLY